MVDQPQLELQLKVWKELAISKQVLMRAATDALKLDPNCTQDELKQALEAVIKKMAKADADVAAAQEQARVAIGAMEKKVAASEQALTAAQATVAELQTAQENAAKQIAAERAAAAKELQKFKERLAEKEKALKSINTALADTPENVVKKMNVLKKQKQEEAESRRKVETALNSMRAEKRKQEQQTTEVLRNTEKLVTQYRDVHGLSLKLHEQLKPLLADEKELPKVPDLDSKLVEEIEQTSTKLKKGIRQEPAESDAVS